MNSGSDVIVGLLLLIPAIVIYFLPSIIAGLRGHRQADMVFVINLFFGWTLVGWVVALTIAASATR
jgi:hypothetical protein